MVGLALVGGALRYWMRELLNGLSRRIEYDLRNALFAHLLNARRRLLRPHAHRRHHGAADERPERRAHGRRARRSCTSRTRSSAARSRSCSCCASTSRLTLLALLPMVAAPGRSRSARAARSTTRFEAVQEHFSDAHDPRAGEPRRRARRARVSAGARRDRALRARSTRSTSSGTWRSCGCTALMNPAFGLLAGLGAVVGARPRRRARGARHDLRRRVRRVRLVPRHAHLAADRARLGDQPVPARRGVDGAPARDPRRARRRCARPTAPRALPPARVGTHARVSRRRLPLPDRRSGAEPRWVLRNVSLHASRPARRSASSARRAAARAR